MTAPNGIYWNGDAGMGRIKKSPVMCNLGGENITEPHHKNTKEIVIAL